MLPGAERQDMLRPVQALWPAGLWRLKKDHDPYTLIMKARVAPEGTEQGN
jgi:hypothetical protein